jgi:ATP-dependent Lon protease
LAEHRAGINTIIIPAENKKDVDEIPENVKEKVKFVYASDMDTVLSTALARHSIKRIKSGIAGKVRQEIIAEEQTAVADMGKNMPVIEQ